MQRIVAEAIRKITAILCIAGIFFSLAVPSALADTTLENVTVKAAPLLQKSETTNGMVRVYLVSLGNPSRLDVTVSGSYSVNGNVSQSIAGGTALSVGFNSSTGSISLTLNGVTTNMGGYLALRRHSASGENGVRIAQARDSANLYPGDLSFRAVAQDGGYKLYTVAHIYIENYLYGVLPYEMGNSNSIEALKAQAVAARTYTVRMVQNRRNGYFDVYDNTMDQMYCGTPGGNANCVAAVNATKGIVLMYGSEYITTYYSASNGGQTETSRSSTAYPYLVVKDDPFDYANPSSAFKSKTISADLTGNANPEPLLDLLRRKAASALGTTSAGLTLLTLNAVTPHTPKYAAPSRLYTKMDFQMNVSLSGVNQSATVTCDIFGELEGLLNLSLQSSQNELWSVKQSGSTFVFQARRYGHAMGMSQRGAMYMAKLGYTYVEILGFYYDGCTRVQHNFTNTILDQSGDTQTTIEDPVEIAPTSPASCTGTVHLVGSAGTLAIRTSKSVTSSMIGTAGNGAIVTVLAGDGQWCFIRYGNLQGYVPANALTLTGTPTGAEGTPTSIMGFSTVTASSSVNLRDGASYSANVVSSAPHGAVLTIFTTVNGWAYAQYCAMVAYIDMSYLSAVVASYPGETVSTGSVTAQIHAADGSETVDMLASPSMSAMVLERLPNAAPITVTADDGSWCTVVYQSRTGYILKRYVTYTGETLTNGTPSVGDPGSAGSLYAIVTTPSGSLNMRAEAGAGSRVLTTIPVGARIPVLSLGDTWCGVSYGGYVGYVMRQFLRLEEGNSGGTETSGETTAIVNTGGGTLNLREAPKAGSAILRTIPQFATVVVHSRGEEWCNVTYQGTTGYVMTAFLVFSERPPESHGTAVVTTESGSLNMRSAPSSDASVITRVPRNATVSVLERGASWTRILYISQSGYVMTAFLTFQDDDDDPVINAPIIDPVHFDETAQIALPWTAEERPDTEPLPSDEDSEVILVNPQDGVIEEEVLTAYVQTSSGALNLRETTSEDAKILASIPQNAKVSVVGYDDDWCTVVWRSIQGCVMTKYLTFEETSPEPEILQPPISGIANDGGIALDVTLSVPDGTLRALATPISGDTSLAVFSQCLDTIEPLSLIPCYDEVEIVLLGEEWCLIAYQGMQGYCRTENLSILSE